VWGSFSVDVELSLCGRDLRVTPTLGVGGERERLTCIGIGVNDDLFVMRGQFAVIGMRAPTTQEIQAITLAALTLASGVPRVKGLCTSRSKCGPEN
jgi:hypothetical protein